MDAYCNTLKLKFPKLEYAVAFGSEPQQLNYISTEELLYKNFKNWGHEKLRRAEEDQKILQLKLEGIDGREKEYPDDDES